MPESTPHPATGRPEGAVTGILAKSQADREFLQIGRATRRVPRCEATDGDRYYAPLLATVGSRSS
jgi:hypothetical protein